MSSKGTRLGHPLPSGIFVTIYNDLRGQRALPIIGELMSHAAPGDLGVCIHDPPSDDDASLASAIKARGWRLIYGWGVDPDARRTVRDAAAVTRRRTRLAMDRGAEAVELNGEAAWKAEGLDEHAREMIAAARDGGAEVVGWSFFDGPRSHRMPAATAVFGDGGVDYSAPQVYAANPGASELPGFDAARTRYDRAVAQHEWCVARGLMRRDLVPGQRACAVYAQIHGVSPSGTAWLLDRGPVGRAWAIPTRHDASGLVGLRAVLRARREMGPSADAIKRWQQAHGLKVDGVAGPATLGAMGLA